MGNISEHIARRRAEIARESGDLENLEKLAGQYPDLSTTSAHHWGQMLTSPSINSLADKVRFVNGCSSCSHDAPLEARPYIEVEGGKSIFTPNSYRVGESVGGYGFHPVAGWRETMASDGISEAVIAQVEEYLKENPPELD